MEEYLTVELPEEQWKLIFFLVKRGVIEQMQNEHIHTPGCGCISGFADAMLRLSNQLPAEVTSPRPQSRETLPPHPTSPTKA
jgi:hypothetical protein